MRTFVAATVLAAIVALLAAGAGAAPQEGGCTVFPDFTGSAKAKSAADQTAWNQDITKAPVHKRSKQIIRQINRTAARTCIPTSAATASTGSRSRSCRRASPTCRSRSAPTGTPTSPTSPRPRSPRTRGSRAAPTPTATATCSSSSRAIAVSSSSTAPSRGSPAPAPGRPTRTAFFDLNQAGPLRPAGFTSADAAGLPIFPGLVRFDEVAAGRVEHAIRMTFDETRQGYIPPATHHASDSCDSNDPPMGMRFRLKGSYYKQHLGDFPEGSQSRAIFEAFRHYGTINADNGSNWYFQGSMDVRWDDDDLGRLKEIPGSAFQVVKSPAKQKTPC